MTEKKGTVELPLPVAILRVPGGISDRIANEIERQSNVKVTAHVIEDIGQLGFADTLVISSEQILSSEGAVEAIRACSHLVVLVTDVTRFPPGVEEQFAAAGDSVTLLNSMQSPPAEIAESILNRFQEVRG